MLSRALPCVPSPLSQFHSKVPFVAHGTDDVCTTGLLQVASSNKPLTQPAHCFWLEDRSCLKNAKDQLISIGYDEFLFVSCQSREKWAASRVAPVSDTIYTNTSVAAAPGHALAVIPRGLGTSNGTLNQSSSSMRPHVNLPSHSPPPPSGTTNQGGGIGLLLLANQEEKKNSNLSEEKKAEYKKYCNLSEEKKAEYNARKGRLQCRIDGCTKYSQSNSDKCCRKCFVKQEAKRPDASPQDIKKSSKKTDRGAEGHEEAPSSCSKRKALQPDAPPRDGRPERSGFSEEKKSEYKNYCDLSEEKKAEYNANRWEKRAEEGMSERTRAKYNANRRGKWAERGKDPKKNVEHKTKAKRKYGDLSDEKKAEYNANKRLKRATLSDIPDSLGESNGTINGRSSSVRPHVKLPSHSPPPPAGTTNQGNHLLLAKQERKKYNLSEEKRAEYNVNRREKRAEERKDPKEKVEHKSKAKIKYGDLSEEKRAEYSHNTRSKQAALKVIPGSLGAGNGTLSESSSPVRLHVKLPSHSPPPHVNRRKKRAEKRKDPKKEVEHKSKAKRKYSDLSEEKKAEYNANRRSKRATLNVIPGSLGASNGTLSESSSPVRPHVKLPSHFPPPPSSTTNQGDHLLLANQENKNTAT